ncbi:substrate-binding periplasmic protein [Fundidesulfovibrio terrae]|uniref:substrate-binding periplasmic protein n=1 Tax=Fundidesulfovibrio terrae TaxID=2922866 RepID=UPI001FAF588D|nr:transporter substrate-binding domain-containing protein [Fundidesulfovibrio terrae]
MRMRKGWAGVAALAVILGVLASKLLSLAAAPKVMTFVSLNWEPYAAETIPGNGFTTEIIAEACKRAGYEAQFTFMPWKRVLAETEAGDFDALFNAYHSEDRARRYALSEPYAASPLVVCAKAGSGVRYDGTLESLKPYRIGVVAGYVNTPEFDGASFLNKEETLSDITNLKKLIQGRVDLIVIDKYTAIQLLKSSPTLEAGLSDVVFLSPELDNKPLYAMFSRKKDGYREKRDAFNRGLKAVQQDGTVNAILEKYGFSRQE